MRALVAPDKFKGTFTAAEVADAIAEGMEEAGIAAERMPVADGGDGTGAVLMAALGGEWREAGASDPLGRTVDCRYALLDDGGTAVVEVAEASGLARLDPGELDPLAATSRGTGELIDAAARGGAARVLVACGGSATTDGGAGALGAFDPGAVELVCLCDTDVPFTAAAAVYGPQKGASHEQVRLLEQRLGELAATLPHDPRRLPFTGAAGGLAGGLWAHGARLVPGARHVLSAIGFDRALGAADLAVTGEGRVDSTSFRGKAVGEVVRRATAAGVPCHAIVGRDGLGPDSAERAALASVTTASTLAELRAAAVALGRRSTLR